MRNITAGALAKLAQETGTEPVNYVDIQWIPGGPWVRYSAAVQLGAYPTLANVNDFDTGVNIQTSSFGVSCSVTLNDDQAGSLLNIINTHNIHKSPCRVYHWYPDLPTSDAFIIFQGQISSPVTWNESQRQLSFTILDQIYSRDVGFSLEQGQFSYISDDVVGQSWPVVFGEALHVPAVRALDVLKATSTTIFGIPDPTLILKRTQMESDLENYFRAYNYFIGLIYLLQQSITPYYVTKQVLRISSASGACTLSYKGVETGSISKASTVADVDNAIKSVTQDWVVTDTRLSNTITLFTFTFQYDTNKYKKIQDALAAIKPAAFSIKTQDSFFGNTAAQMIPTKVTLDDAEIDYTSYETMIYTRAKEVQEEYADAIIAEDALKQEIEDLSTDADKANKIYDQIIRVYEKDGDADLRDRLQAALTLKNHYITALLAKTQALTLASFNKEKIEVDAHNLKFVFESIKNLKRKIIELFDAWVRLKKRYDTLLRIIEQQDNILVPSGKVQDSYQFAQATDVDVVVKGVTLKGQFDLGEFTITSAEPTYRNVLLDTRQSDDLDYFWIQDDTIDLSQKYCKIQSSNSTLTNRIIFVDEQVGNRCRFQLVKKKSNIRSSPDDFTFSGINDAQIKDAFGSSLIGTETLAQLIAIANSIPKDIAKDIYKRLQGGNYVQVLRTFQPGKTLAEDPGSGNFQLRYNGQITDLIPHTANESNIQTAIVAGTGLKDADINVECWQFDKYAAMQDYAKAYAAAYQNPSGSFDNNGVVTEFRITFTTAATSTKPVPMYPLEVVTTRPVDAAGTDIGFKTQPTAAVPTPVNIYLDTYIQSTGAHEFTVKQIISKIENAVEASKHGKEFKSIQGKIEEISDQLLLQMQNGATAAEIKELRDLIMAQEIRFQQLLTFVKIPEQVLADAYKLISSSEQKVLFAMELLHFLAWRHSLVPIAAYFPDPHLEYVVVGQDITAIKEASPIILYPWLGPYKRGTRAEIMENALTLPNSEAFIIEPGTEIASLGDFQQVYVANIMPSTVRSVYAYKIVDGLQKLLPVPSEYYNKNEADNYGRFTLTSISLKKPLSEYREQNWIDGLFVSLVSSVGPNPMDVVAWVLANFSNLTLDSGTYTALHAKLANYPTHFALLDKIDALTLIKDIAYQARCACWLNHDTVHMVYLPEEGTSIHTFTEDNAFAISYGFTDSDLITTNYIANWRFDYSKDKKFKHILRYNVKRFEEQKEEHDFYTLTDKGLVDKTATFWLIRKSNVWKQITFKAPLDAMNIEPFDTVTLDFAGDYFATGAVKGVIQSANYNPSDKSMTFIVWLPILAGKMTPYIFAWPANLLASDIYPLSDDIIAGNAGDPFADNVPNGIDYDPFATNPTNIRPQDYGDITPTDLTDTLPVSILGNIEEVTSLPPVPENFNPGIEDAPEADMQAPVQGADVNVMEQIGADIKEINGIGGFFGNGNATRLVKIVRKNEDKTEIILPSELTLPTTDPLDPLLEDIEVVTQWYDVVDSEGKTFPVEVPGLHPNDVIPGNSRLIAIYSEKKGQWEGYIPTYLNDSQEVADAAEIT